MDNLTISHRNPRWQNQEEAYQFAMAHPSCMLDMEMGTGKTRVAIDVAMDRVDVRRVLVVCPKAVMDVWPRELEKHAARPDTYECWVRNPKLTTCKTAGSLKEFIQPRPVPGVTRFAVINYDSVWRREIGDCVLRAEFDMVILDESHRAKAAGSKVSKYLAMLGKRTRYKMCLSGTPMANSPLDVYGQYRFLDRGIFGTSHDAFLQEYAIMGGPERRFIVGYKNQKTLQTKFQTIAYTCKMSDVASRLKLPESLPPVCRMVSLPAKDLRTLRELSKEFIADCGSGDMVVLNSVLSRAVRMQQIASGFCMVQEAPGETPWPKELNDAKRSALADLLEDISVNDPVVVFCLFKHDLDAVAAAASEAKRSAFELSGRANDLEHWQCTPGAVLAVQIQAGAEGVDMTCANHAIYFSLPYSLALYEQSKARLYRPGQMRPVTFLHLLAEGTIDEAIYDSLCRKKDLITSIKDGTLNYGWLKGGKK